MEIWLSMGNDRLRLPVLPSSFQLTVGNLNNTININDLGEINLIGKTGLKSLSLASFFPAQNYYFVEYNGFPKPFEFINKLEQWRLSGNPIRVIITKTYVNLAMSIENFNYGERDGTKDVYYDIELKEYKHLKVKSKANNNEYVPPKTKRPVPKPTKPKKVVHIIKKGDNLWNIAKKYTGNAMNWKRIYADNKKVVGSNPNLIYPGQRIVI